MEKIDKRIAHHVWRVQRCSLYVVEAALVWGGRRDLRRVPTVSISQTIRCEKYELVNPRGIDGETLSQAFQEVVVAARLVTNLFGRRAA
ncbi:hypothetical protein VT84_32975 [Gemmata sp. SH-PL17]|nr:hypothetical protein VT84_32975 [Gemmata sp. SH-PL17]